MASRTLLSFGCDEWAYCVARVLEYFPKTLALTLATFGFCRCILCSLNWHSIKGLMMRLFSFMLISLFVGCVHVPLRKNTLKQAQSLSDLHEQQVLSNIAKSIAEPNSVPYFAIPKAGSTQVTGTGGSTLSLVWNPRTIVSETLGLNASGTLSENWTLEPINNPDKLILMSCLLKHVSGKTYGECEDCEKRLTTFFKEKYPICLPQCWFHHGCKSDVPKHCRKVSLT